MSEQDWDEPDDEEDEPDELEDDAVEHLTAPESPHDPDEDPL